MMSAPREVSRGVGSPALSWERLYVLGVFLVFCFRVLYLLVPLRCGDLENAYGLLVIGALLGAYLSRRAFSDGRMAWLLLVWTAWVLISRWLNRDVYLFIDGEMLLHALLGFLLFSAGLVADREGRLRLLRGVTLVYAGFFVLVALAGLFAAATNVSMRVSPENVWINVWKNGQITGLNALSVHRLVAACRFYVAWALLLLACFRTGRWGLRCLYLLGMLILQLAISLCFSRTTQICFSLTAGMLAFLLCWRRFRGKKPVRIALCAGLFAAAFLLAYLSFTPCTRLLTAVNRAAAPRFEQYYNGLAQKPDPESFAIQSSAVTAAPTARKTAARPTASLLSSTVSQGEQPQATQFVDERSLIGNWTLTGRTGIWASVIPAVRDNPRILFIGRLTKGMMEVQNTYIKSNEYKPHMHNAYVQSFMLTGLPGLLILIVWTLGLLRRMLRAYFASAGELPLNTALLTLPLAGVLLYNMCEISIFPIVECSGAVFFLLAGVLTAELRDAKAL